MITVEECLKRAASAANKKTIYTLGGGNWKNPDKASPKDSYGGCDCSCYTAWIMKVSKQTTLPGFVKFNGGWLNTDGIVNDALRNNELFYILKKPKVGCFPVFPARSGSHLIGHIGFATQCIDDKITKIMHCSSGNYRNQGDAILETSAAVFNIKETKFVWYKNMVTGGSYG